MPPIQCIIKEQIPERLRNIHPPLRRLYCRGPMPDFSAYKCLAVVGARRWSEYGKQVCESLIAGLKDYPILIISGLAIGIDSIAHQAALDNGLPTLAVPGSGLDEKVLYPKSKISLAKDILQKGGCLMSEYAPTEPASAWTFPERNRIMAGLADAVLIIEAEKKSGTLITARIALDYNKEVLAVPASIFSPLSEGPHFLIKQGATPVTCAKDIVEAFGLTWNDDEMGNVQTLSAPSQDTLFENCSEEEKEILALLPSSRDDIIRTLQKPVHEVQMRLTLLELKGLVKEEVGLIKMI